MTILNYGQNYGHLILTIKNVTNYAIKSKLCPVYFMSSRRRHVDVGKGKGSTACGQKRGG